MSPTPIGAARLSFAGASLFAILLGVLHLLKADLDPSWHFISEYAIGEYGFLMTLGFLCRLWFSDTYVRTRTGWRYAFGQSSLDLPGTLPELSTP